MSLRVNDIIDSDGMVRKGNFCNLILNQVTYTWYGNNVSSATDMATGDTTIKFIVHAKASASYTAFISCTGTAASTVVNGQVITSASESEPWFQNSDGVRVIHGISNSFPNSNHLMVNVIGD